MLIKDTVEPYGESIEDGNISLNKYIHDLVTKYKLFKSGHFRLNETKSARDWIDLERLFALEKDVFIEPVTEVIFNSILQTYKKEDGSVDLMLIGFNYYGAILASVIGYKYNLPFSYCFKEHSNVDEIENELQAIDGKQIVIITDVMVFGRTISKFVNKLYKKGIVGDDIKIEVVVLFERKTGEKYIASTYLHPKIKNMYVLNDDFDIEICKKNREECLFIKDKKLCQDNSICF